MSPLPYLKKIINAFIKSPEQEKHRLNAANRPPARAGHHAATCRGNAVLPQAPDRATILPSLNTCRLPHLRQFPAVDLRLANHPSMRLPPHVLEAFQGAGLP